MSHRFTRTTAIADIIFSQSVASLQYLSDIIFSQSCALSYVAPASATFVPTTSIPTRGPSRGFSGGRWSCTSRSRAFDPSLPAIRRRNMWRAVGSNVKTVVSNLISRDIGAIATASNLGESGDRW